MPQLTKQPTVQAAKATQVEAMPDNFRAYVFHGVGLTWRASDKNAVGACPWCGKEEKFSVSLATGQWRCFSCGGGADKGGGNLTTFLRMLWNKSDEATNGESEVFAKERGLLYSDTLMHWGVVKSVLTGEWLIPGHNVSGELCQLYKRIKFPQGWELRPTPTVPHYLHGIPLFDKNRSMVYLHESWGNALAFWEIGRMTKLSDGACVQTGNEAASLLADANVLSVANCGAVGASLERFLPLFAGKKVVLCFDSDHPGKMEGAGFAATKRAAKLLSGAKEPPAEISWLKWGEGGFDPALKSGYDARDFLNAS